MKIVIDIPEETYRRIQALVNADYFEHDICGRSMQRIANGTPLPKGHGRLIDADALEVSMADDWHTANEIASCIKCAPTIIEADKESD